MKIFKGVIAYFVILILLLIIKIILFTVLISENVPSLNSFMYSLLIFGIYFSIPLVLGSLAVNNINFLNQKGVFRQLMVGIMIGICLYLYYYLTIGINNERLSVEKKWFVFLENIFLGVCLVFLNHKLIKTRT